MFKFRKTLTIPLSVVLLFSATASIAFLVFNSRLSADEYLLAPVLKGFYVDAPERELFEVTNNIFFDYLQAVKAISLLGWDPFGNAATFQMIPAVLANYFGPFASTFLAAVVHAVVILVALAFAIQLVKSSPDRIIFMSVFTLSLFIGVIAGNFQTEQVFGIFPLTGIRFSSYLIQPLLLLLLIFFFIKDILVGGVNRKLLSFTFIAFPMFVSLWTTMYLILLVPTVFIAANFIGKIRSGAVWHWTRIYAVVLGLAAFNASFVLFPKVDAGRAVTETADSADSLTDYALTYLLSEKAGTYFFGVLQTIFSDHSGIGLFAGLVLALFLGKNLLLTETSFVFIIALFAFTLSLPFVFTFQELITYPAFWHKTAPIVYSFVLWFFLGLLAGKKLRLKFHEPILIASLSSLALIAAVAFVEVTHLRERVFSAGQALVAFRTNWDSGDPFGVGTSLENLQQSTILNFMQLGPYRHPFWFPPNEILKDVNLVFESSASQANSLKEGDLKIRANSAYFSKELGEKISIEFEVVDRSITALGRRSISNFTSLDSDVYLSSIRSPRGLLISGEMPLNKTFVLTFDGNCKKFSRNSADDCFEILGAKPGFSQEFRRFWSPERLSR